MHFYIVWRTKDSQEVLVSLNPYLARDKAEALARQVYSDVVYQVVEARSPQEAAELAEW